MGHQFKTTTMQSSCCPGAKLFMKREEIWCNFYSTLLPCISLYIINPELLPLKHRIVSGSQEASFVRAGKRKSAFMERMRLFCFFQRLGILSHNAELLATRPSLCFNITKSVKELKWSCYEDNLLEAEIGQEFVTVSGAQDCCSYTKFTWNPYSMIFLQTANLSGCWGIF